MTLISVGAADFTGSHPIDERGASFECATLADLAAWLNQWTHPTADKTDRGPYWRPGPPRERGIEADWPLLVLDYDGNEPPPDIMLLDRVVYETRSSSDSVRRWRVIVDITRPVTSAEVRRLIRHFESDPGAGGRNRLFWGQHPRGHTAVYVAGVSGPLNVDALLASLPPEPEPTPDAEWTDGPVAEWRGPADDTELINRALRSTSAEEVYGDKPSFADLWAANIDKLAGKYPPKKHGVGFDLSSADIALCNKLMFWTGNDCERTARLLRQCAIPQPKYDREDYVRGTVLAAWQPNVYSDPRAPAAPPPAAVVPPAPTDSKAVGALSSLAGSVTFDRQGRIEATLANIAHVLRTDHTGNIRYDAFTDQTIVAGEPLTDELVSRLRIALERQRVAPPSKETMRDALECVGRENAYDSAQDWLGALVWDGAPRVDTFFPAYAGTEDTPYTRSVGAYLFTAMAGRVLSPGCKADMVPVFIGAQGVARKSSTVAALAPEPERFVDIDLRERDADLSRRMRGKLVAELSELRGLAKRDLESLKSFITRTHEGWIPKYREFEMSYPRRLVFVGTTNHEQFLEDETGNRRWLPVHVRAFNREAVERDRAQLWAEGAARFAAGGIAWANAERLAAPVHAAHMVSDSWEQLVETWVTTQHAPFAMSDALRHAVGLHASQMNRAAELRMGRTLKGLGWSSKPTTVNGRLTRRWVKD